MNKNKKLKIMTWKGIKNIVNQMTDEELEQSAVYSNDNNETSGNIHSIEKIKSDLYKNDESFDSLEKSDLLYREYTEEQIKKMEIVYKAGTYIIHLD